MAVQHNRLDESNAGSVTVVVIVAILVGIALLALVAGPCLLNSMDFKRQKATMRSMQQVAHKLETIHAARGRFPSSNEFESLLGDTELAKARRDGWRRPWRYEPREDGYLLLSLGKDGVRDFEGSASRAPNSTNSFDADIAIDTGAFVQFPEGMNPS